MSSTWGTIRSALLFFGPILIPRAISYYRKQKAGPKLPVQPVPSVVARGLVLLGVVATVLLITTLPNLRPENLFERTDSRLQIPVDVLFSRVAKLRPSGELTARDESLRARFVNLESRLLYFQYGPEVLGDCPFCSSEQSHLYQYYALPSLLAPHLTNLIMMGLATSPLMSASYGSPWRALATISAAILAFLDIYLVSSYNYQLNSTALRLHELDFFYWRMRFYRYLALAALDAGLAWVIYLSSTNRAFTIPPDPAEQVDAATSALNIIKSKLVALSIIRNTVIRDEGLRGRTQEYWQHEGRVMRSVMEERDVIEGIHDALQSGRVNMETVTRDAEGYAQSVLQPLHPEEEISPRAKKDN